ncbi:MAG: hypothetical protein WCJ09_20905, partial [Planctomycetota bacterium]
GSSRRLRLLAASPLLAWSAQELAEADPGRWDRLADTISRLALDLSRQGLLASLTQLLDHQGLARLALGGRLLADLMQAAELVQECMHREHLGAAAAAVTKKSDREAHSILNDTPQVSFRINGPRRPLCELLDK